MKKELCTPCAMALTETRDVKFISRGTDQKITCMKCGRRRYGGIYEVRRKNNKKERKE